MKIPKKSLGAVLWDGVVLVFTLFIIYLLRLASRILYLMYPIEAVGRALLFIPVWLITSYKTIDVDEYLSCHDYGIGDMIRLIEEWADNLAN